MTAPSPKESLELKPCPFCGSEITHIESLARSFDPPRTYHEWHHKDDAEGCPIRLRGKIVCASTDDLQATKRYRDAWNTRATLQPSGERREAMQQLIMKSQDCGYGDEDANGKHRRMFCDDDSLSSYHRNDKCDCRAVFDAILASGFVQDEAGIREIAAQAALARIRRVRDGYANQAKFADVEPASYFREFIRRLDDAVNPKEGTPPWNGNRSARDGGAS